MIHMGLLHFTKAINLECYRWPCFLPYVEIDIQHETKMPTHSREKLICKMKRLLPAFQVPAMLPPETQLPLCLSRSALLFRLHESHKIPKVLTSGWLLCFNQISAIFNHSGLNNLRRV